MPIANTPPAPTLQMDLREAGLMLRRRWAVLGGAVALGLALAVVFLLATPARYTATAKVMIDPRAPVLFGTEQILSALPANAETVQSEIEVLRARDLAERVVRHLSLEEHPAFRTSPIDRFIEHLDVRAVGRSRVIAISFTSHDPTLSAQAVNTLVEAYLADQIALRTRASLETSTWLQERLSALQKDAEMAEEALARFRSAHALTDKHQRDRAANTPQRADDLARLKTLEHEAGASRALYEKYLERSKQVAQQEGIGQTDSRLISRAGIPLAPDFPRPLPTFVLALVVSAFIGVLLGLALEHLDAGFRSSEQIEAHFGLPSFALVPALKTGDGAPLAPEASVWITPHGAYAEAIRIARLSLLSRRVSHKTEHPPKIIQITSSLPAEGKTALSIALAASASMSGQKVLLLDADIRRPRLHEALAIDNTVGLTDLVRGQTTLQAALRHKTQKTTSSETPSFSFDVIPAGRLTPNAGDLLRSAAMKDLLDTLAARYDLILIDSPPVLPVADSRMLCGVVDAVLYVVKWSTTPRKSVAYALRQLGQIHPDAVTGFVINHVDLTRHAQYGYADSTSYSKEYRQY